jgi:hypothetical protein
MVRMVVGHDDPDDGQSAEPPGEDPLPPCRRIGRRIPGIDDRPAGAVIEQPKVDVIEREGKSHAQPLDPRRNRQRLTRGWRHHNRKSQRRRQASVHNVFFSPARELTGNLGRCISPSNRQTCR